MEINTVCMMCFVFVAVVFQHSDELISTIKMRSVWMFYGRSDNKYVSVSYDAGN